MVPRYLGRYEVRESDIHVLDSNLYVPRYGVLIQPCQCRYLNSLSQDHRQWYESPGSGIKLQSMHTSLYTAANSVLLTIVLKIYFVLVGVFIFFFGGGGL